MGEHASNRAHRIEQMITAISNKPARINTVAPWVLIFMIIH